MEINPLSEMNDNSLNLDCLKKSESTASAVKWISFFCFYKKEQYFKINACLWLKFEKWLYMNLKHKFVPLKSPRFLSETHLLICHSRCLKALSFSHGVLSTMTLELLGG